MSDSAPIAPLKFWTELIHPYQIRSMWMLVVSLPILVGYIAYTWHTQTPLEYLHWLPETIGGVLSLVNMVFAIFLLCRASWFTFKKLHVHLSIIGNTMESVQSGKRFKQSRLSASQTRQLLMPIGLIFSHILVVCLICLPSTLLINSPHIA